MTEKLMRADEATVKLLDKLVASIVRVEQLVVRQTPLGVVEPLNPITVSSVHKVVHPPYRNKLWFSVTIVKEEKVQLHLRVNTGQSTIPYTMSADEKVYDQNFGVPCIYDVELWTEPGDSCTVKVRGSR